jgi:vitamin B12 transporter
VTVFRRLNLSFTGRYDGEIGGDGFLTGRATAAYSVPETWTKFRASAGTAAKRPTAYMIGNNAFAVLTNPSVQTDLRPENSIGADVGIDQGLFDGRLTVSATGFINRFTDLINFNTTNSGYENIANASTAGVELSGTAELIPSRLTVTASYTYLEPRDLDKGTDLPRRPRHSGAIALTYTGESGFEATLSGTLVGPRFNKAGGVEPLAGYVRLDLEASYPINPATMVFARIENLTDARYQDPGGYNTPGLSAYVGLTWNK